MHSQHPSAREVLVRRKAKRDLYCLSHFGRADIIQRDSPDAFLVSRHQYRLDGGDKRCTESAAGRAQWDRGTQDAIFDDGRLDEAESVAKTHSVPFFSDGLISVLRSLVWVDGGRASERISQLRDAIDRLSALGHNVSVPGWKATLAAWIARNGDNEGGLSLIEETLTQIERPGWEERVHLAEILRLKSGMLQREGKLDEAERDLRASIEIARNQGARCWELRAATSLARLLITRGERSAAKDLLRPIYNWFTEGFDTRDLRGAKALLEELS